MATPRTAAAIAAVALSALTLAPSARSEPPCPVVASLLPDGIPKDVCDNNTGDGVAAFADMAWQTFKMLVWPARIFSSNGEPLRGEPDTTLDLSNRDPALPRVFETFKGAWETFPLRGMDPLDWNRYPPNAKACQDDPALKPGMLVLAELSLQCVARRFKSEAIRLEQEGRCVFSQSQ